MHFFAHRTSALKSGWVRFDFVLVGMGVITSWIINPIMSLASNGEDSAVKETMAPLMVLRVLRLFRLARAVRLLVQFKTLWMLVRGLLSSAGTIFYTFSLITLILYIFACLGIELISKNPLRETDKTFDELAEEFFPNLWTTMLTLVAFVNLDSVGAIYAPMIRRDPL